MLYLLDANVLIVANRDYYPLGRVPEFWEWLLDRASRQQTKIPVEMYEEVLAGHEDELTRWLKENRDMLVLDEEVDAGLVAVVTEAGYAPDLSDEEVERIGRDPFLIAYALVNPAQRMVVTTEHSKPKKQRANRHIPDVCGRSPCVSLQHLRVHRRARLHDRLAAMRLFLERDPCRLRRRVGERRVREVRAAEFLDRVFEIFRVEQHTVARYDARCR